MILLSCLINIQQHDVNGLSSERQFVRLLVNTVKQWVLTVFPGTCSLRRDGTWEVCYIMSVSGIRVWPTKTVQTAVKGRITRPTATHVAHSVVCLSVLGALPWALTNGCTGWDPVAWAKQSHWRHLVNLRVNVRVKRRRCLCLTTLTSCFSIKSLESCGESCGWYDAIMLVSHMRV